MVRHFQLTLLSVGALMAGTSDLAAQPEQAPPSRTVASSIPDGYCTVETAAKARFTLGAAARTELAGYLGVSVKRDDKGQVVVEEVQHPDSPGARAGVKKGDIVLQIDEHPVRTVQAFREWLQTYGPGKTLKLSLQRDGKPVSATVTLIATSRPIKSGPGGVFLGLELGDSAEGGGVFVERVSPDSPAATAGLKNGDRIVKLDGKDLPKADILNEVLTKKKAGDTITFTVRRDNKELPEVKATLAGERGGGGGRPGGPAREQPLTLWTKETIRLAVIPIEFTDIKHNAKITPKELDYALLSRGIYTERNATGQAVHGSLHDWLREQSNGKLRMDDGKVFDWVEVSKKRGDYIQGNGTAGSNRTAVLTEALDKIIARDANALQGFDAICFVYAGDRVRTNAGAIFYPHAGSITHTKAGRFPYFLGVEGGTTMTPVGGYAKSFSQMLGLPDLAARTENAGSEGLGKWCALSDLYPSGTGFTGLPAVSRPQHLSAWAKEKLGWLTPAVIDPSVKQKLVLAPIEDSPNECFKVLVRPDGSEYLLLEVRRKRGFDTDLPGEGLLIWRVVNGRPILEESHGIEGPTGPTTQLSAVPYPSAANNAFTPDTIPSSRSPLGGGFAVHITEIRRLADGKVAFQIGYEYR